MRVMGSKTALSVLLGVSLAINVLQGTRLLKLTGAIAEQEVRGELPEGAVVRNLEVKDLSGRSVVIDFHSTEKSTVLYVFKPSCAWCERNSASVDSLARQLPQKYRLIGLSLSKDGLRDFVRTHAISFPVYQDLSSDLVATYGLGSTPETIVIGPGGTVVASWKGAFLGSTRLLLEKFFSLRLADFAL